MRTTTSTPHPQFALVQMNATDSVAENLAGVQAELQKVADAGAEVALLPENFAWMGDEKDAHTVAEPYGAGEIQDFLADASRSSGLWLIAGSLKLHTQDAHKVTNTQLAYNPSGECVARYDKIHLFDAEVAVGEAYRESDAAVRGDQLAWVDTPCGRVGMSICYDLRFPSLYQALAAGGAELLVVPSAFTYTTGVAHWASLLRARAIENQAYVLAAAQTGEHANGRSTYGHSMIIDPWGRVMVDAGVAPGGVIADIDLEHLRKIRQLMPVASHHRQGGYPDF